MSSLIVNDTGDTELILVARVRDCLRFFSLDAFGARPVDTRMRLRQL